MMTIIVGIVMLLVGAYLGLKKSDDYWIKRIQDGDIPSRENMKFWNPRGKISIKWK